MTPAHPTGSDLTGLGYDSGLRVFSCAARTEGLCLQCGYQLGAREVPRAEGLRG